MNSRYLKRPHAHSKLDLDRLCKVCGLFGSNHAGERANAAAMADKLLRDRGLTWRDVLTRSALPARAQAARMSFREQVNLLVDHLDRLDDWQVRFVASMSRYSRPTLKQAAKLAELVEFVLNWRAA